MGVPAVEASPRSEDAIVVLRGVPWEAYLALVGWRGDAPVPRVAYHRGELELMSPSWSHEAQKTRLGRLVEAWAEGAGVDLSGAGSWTLAAPEALRAAEPDECYVRGPLDGEPERPDLVIEVVWTRGGIDKLPVYAVLGVPEVWIWSHGHLTIYVLDDAGYTARPASGVLAELDVAALASAMNASTSQTEAARVMRSVGAAVRRA